MKIQGDNETYPFTEYKDLITEEDWDKYYKGKKHVYSDPLHLAILRTLEKILKKVDQNE